jgi:hypothetical protein
LSAKVICTTVFCIPYYGSYIITALKNATNARDAIGNGHSGQTAAILESIISNACDTIGNRHRGQTAARTESPISNACDAIRNGYRGQAAAILKKRYSNACDAIGNNQISYFNIIDE